MKYDQQHKLCPDANLIGMGLTVAQSQESLAEQLKDLRVLANRFGLYDASDWIDDIQDRYLETIDRFQSLQRQRNS